VGFAGMQKFYTKKTGAGGKLVKLPLASLATLITVHRNLPITVDEEEKDKDGLKQKLDRFLQVVNLSPEAKAGVVAMSDARKWLLLKSYIATGGTLSVSDAPGASGRDAPNNIASKLRVDPSISVAQSLEKCLKEKDAVWLEKFVGAGGAAAALDVIALKDALEVAQKTKDDYRIEDICAQALKKITDTKEFMEKVLAIENSIRKLTLLIGCLILFSPAWARGESESVGFNTFDGVKIEGTFYPSSKGTKAYTVLLLHDFDKNGGSSRTNEWDALATSLQKAEYAVLSFDFRGFC